MPRVYHPYTEMEECADGGGMWRNVTGSAREGYVVAAAKLMLDPGRFKAAMRRALREWPKSCETNLTAEANNQRAWLGHAGCYLAVGSPEECTRLGWHTLNDDQQRAANTAADDVIALWRRRYHGNRDQLDLFAAFGATDA
jgi:hypothetical protein